MNTLFNYNNPIMNGISKIANCIFLCMIWLLCCIPVITAGASTCAMYVTVEKNIKNSRGYTSSTFFSEFRKNFRQATFVWILFLLAELIFYNDYRILRSVSGSLLVGNTYPLFLFFMGTSVVYLCWVLAEISYWSNGTKNILKNALFLMIRHFPTTVFITLLLIFGVVVVYILPVSVFLMPVVIMWLISAPIDKIFESYKKNNEKELL